ncbi:MAG: amidohydrolase family protein, partial [Stellaceae bacterium]
MSELRRIDVHFHVIPEFYRDAVYAAGSGPAIGRYPEWSPAQALELMDASGIAVALTSLAQPGVQFAPSDSAPALARRCNDYAAELKARWPARFGAFATVPLHRADEAVAEIERCYDALGFEGVCLFASYGAKFLGDPFFDPVLQCLDARCAAVFIHPAYHPSSRSLDLPWPGFVMEYLFDTTRAAVNLLLSGALDRFPRIRFILAHAGGTLPYFAWRLSVAPLIDLRLPQWPRERIFAGLKRFWYDIALSPGAQTMGALNAVASPDRILYGSDWPFANARVVAAALQDYTAEGLLPAAARAAIDRGNALTL